METDDQPVDLGYFNNIWALQPSKKYSFQIQQSMNIEWEYEYNGMFGEWIHYKFWKPSRSETLGP